MRKFKNGISVGIVAPSSAVSRGYLERGVANLQAGGLRVSVHSQCFKRPELFFAGTDAERAGAFYEFAKDPAIQILWSARGGYGCARILPLLERLCVEHGMPEKKLLVGYSDTTVLHEWVRARWGWSTLHAPMPGLKEFTKILPLDWAVLLGLIRCRGKAGAGMELSKLWKPRRLRFLGDAPKNDVFGELVGGNLSVWTSLVGTKYQPKVDGRILFFEDIGEGLYRIDRMVQQLAQAGCLKGVRAVVLGSFHQCEDLVPKGLKRRKISLNRALRASFGALGQELGIPVAYGLSVGHGSAGQRALPLGARARLSGDGSLELVDWDWLC